MLCLIVINLFEIKNLINLLIFFILWFDKSLYVGKVWKLNLIIFLFFDLVNICVIICFLKCWFVLIMYDKIICDFFVILMFL